MWSYICLTRMQVVLRSMQGLKPAVGMVPWMRKLLRRDSCAQVCGQGQGPFMVQTWTQMRSGNYEDIQPQSSWKSDAKGKTSEWSREGAIQGLTRLCGLHLETSLFGFCLFYLLLARVPDFTAGRLMLASCVVLFQHSRILFTWYLHKNRFLI